MKRSQSFGQYSGAISPGTAIVETKTESFFKTERRGERERERVHWKSGSRCMHVKITKNNYKIKVKK